jgi:hypothetical protein
MHFCYRFTILKIRDHVSIHGFVSRPLGMEAIQHEAIRCIKAFMDNKVSDYFRIFILNYLPFLFSLD